MNCTILTGTRHYDGPLANDGRWVFDAKYRIALHTDAPFGIVSMEITADSTEYSKTTIVRSNSTAQIAVVEVGHGAQSGMQHMTDREAKGGARLAKPHDSSPEKQGEVQPRRPFPPPIQELDRIFQAKDGDAVLLGVRG